MGENNEIPAERLMDTLREALDRRDENPSKHTQAQVLECLLLVAARIATIRPEVVVVTADLQAQLADLNN
jgi:hypothetical protein